MKLKGIAGVRGLATGPAKIWERQKMEGSVVSFPTEDSQREIDKLTDALKRSSHELEEMIQGLEREKRSEESKILRFQQMLLMDSEIIHSTKKLIVNGKMQAEGAFFEVIHREISNLLGDQATSAGEDYFAGRASDYEDLLHRVLKELRGGDKSIFSLDRDCVLVSEDLRPTEILNFIETKRVKGIVLEKGGVTSHSVIIASARKIPTVIGLGEKIKEIGEGHYLLIDGDQGEIICEPTPIELNDFEMRRAESKREMEVTGLIRKREAFTSDGLKVQFEANIGFPEEIDESMLDQVDGIGLLRTEFLFLGQETEPTEEYQSTIYRLISEKMGDRFVNVRILDLGGDKVPSFIILPHEPNPSLGIRGIRLGIRHEKLLKRQIRAILRANVNGNLRLLLPMVTRVEEVEIVKSVIDGCMEELTREGHKVSQEVSLGIMVEVPSVALCLDLFIPLVDFISVGTNDLTQYVLALDRESEELKEIYSPFYPSVLRMLKKIVQKAREGNKSLSICGEMAGQPLAIPLLIGLGFDRLSMVPSKIREIKSLIGLLRFSECKEMAEHVLGISKKEEIEQILASFVGKIKRDNS